MKRTHCILIMNTRNGHVLKPVHCSSIRQAIRTAKEYGLAYRIIVNGKQVKHGWII